MKITLLTIVIMFVLTGCCKVIYPTLDIDPALSKKIATEMIRHYLNPKGGVSTDFKDRPLMMRLDKKAIKALKSSGSSVTFINAAYTKDIPGKIVKMKDSLTVIIQIKTMKGTVASYEYVDIQDLSYTRCKRTKNIRNDPPTGICPPPRNCTLEDIDPSSN